MKTTKRKHDCSQESLIDLLDCEATGNDPETECKGKIFRCRVNAFVNSKGEYVYQERMIPLKRKSCPGCEKCGHLEDQLPEFISMGTGVNIHGIVDGGIYCLAIVNESRDWESGVVDDWDLAFVLCEE
jgi:hypothetical protein